MLHVVSNQERKADTFYRIYTKTALESGKTYIYGMDIKSQKSGRVDMTVDWTYRDSALALGSTFDWTTVGRTFEVSSDKEYELGILIDEPGEIWIDNFYCYEYQNGKRVGENLVSNGTFGNADSSVQDLPPIQDIEDDEPITGDSLEDINRLAQRIQTSSGFSLSDLERVYGGMKFIPAYPAEGITVDADDSEWDKYPAVRLPSLDTQFASFSSTDYDAYGYFKFAYDDEYLYMTATMYDDVYFPDDGMSSYWMYDTIQLALSKFGESYGKEITFDWKADGSCVVQGGDDSIIFKAAFGGNQGEIIYEIAIPWSFSYGEKPDYDMLINALYNDNDGAGRAYDVEWAEGISKSKDNSAFPHLRLVDWDDDLAWFQGTPIIQNGVSAPYSFFYVNGSDSDKSVHINIPEAGYEEDVTISAKSGIRRDISITPSEVGSYRVTAQITEGAQVTDIEHYITVDPNISRFNASYFSDMREKIEEIRDLINRCKERGIPVKYEEINLAMLEKFLPQLEGLLTIDAQVSRIDHTGTNLEDLYAEAKENLTGYLDGTKTARDVPTYVTSRLRVEDSSIIGMTQWNDGTREERPIFFTGYGHFATAQASIPELNKWGSNAIQMELGISSVIKEPGTVTAWTVNTSGSYDMDITLSDEEKISGSYSLKASGAEPIKADNYKYVTQTVSVKPNTTYEWGLSAKAENATDQIWFSKDGWSNTHSLTGTYDWQQFDFSYTTGADETQFTLHINLASPVDALYIDDIYVREGSNGENLFKNGNFESNGQIIGDYLVDEDAIDSVERVLQNAEDNNVSVCLLLSPHYFPDFLIDKYPELDANVSNFIKYDIMNEKAREATALYIQTLIPRIKDYESLGSICLTNEPQNPGKYEQMTPWWRSYVYDLYNGDIDALNGAWNTKYNNFNEIPISGSADNSQSVNEAVDWEFVEESYDPQATVQYTQSRFSVDWNRFVDETFAEYHQFLADEVHNIAPDIPVHSKVMSHDSGTGLETADGTDYELFGTFSQIHGNDAWERFTPDTKDSLIPSGTTFHHKTVMYEEQRSTKDMPVYNTEDHIMSDGEKYWGYEHAQRLYADMWQGGLHGRVGSIIWLLEQDNNQSATFYGLIHSRPDCIKAVGESTYDMNRLAYELTAFQEAEATVGILRSKTSKAYTANTSYFLANSALFLAGQKSDSIVDNQIEDIHNYKLIILPEVTHVSEKILSELEEYVSNGGKIVGFGENLLEKDDYDRPHDAERVARILENASVYPTVDTADEDEWLELSRNIKNEVKDIGLMNVEVVDADTGDMVDNVEWQSVEYNGTLLVNLISYKWGEDRNVRILVNGEPVTSSEEIISCEERGEVITLEEYAPQLLQIQI